MSDILPTPSPALVIPKRPFSSLPQSRILSIHTTETTPFLHFQWYEDMTSTLGLNSDNLDGYEYWFQLSDLKKYNGGTKVETVRVLESENDTGFRSLAFVLSGAERNYQRIRIFIREYIFEHFSGKFTFQIPLCRSLKSTNSQK